jgi:carbonic anhydrase
VKNKRAEGRSYSQSTSQSGSTLLASIAPGLPDLDSQLSPEEQLSRAVEGNTRWTVRQILNSPQGQARVAEGRLKIVGAVYEIETGLVRFLRPDERT